MFRRKISVSDVFAVRKNSITEGLERLNAFKLKDLQKIQRDIEFDPAKCSQQIHQLRELGVLLSADWDRLRFQPEYGGDPDKLMATIAAMLPPSVLEWKLIREKLLVLSDIYLLLHQQRDTDPMQQKIDIIRDVILPDLEQRLAEVKRSLSALQISNSEMTDKEEALIERKRLFEEEIEERRDRARMLEKEIDVYNIYGGALSQIFTSIGSMQANPKDLKYPIDWLVTVSVQAMMQSSIDPVSKGSFDTTYMTLLPIEELDAKSVDRVEKAQLMIAALMADYKALRDKYGSKRKPAFEQFINDNHNGQHPARKLGLILKTAYQHYPDVIPQNIKDDIVKFNLEKLDNPYSFFLAHVSAPASKVSSSSSGRR